MFTVLLQAAASRNRVSIENLKADSFRVIGRCISSSGARVRSGPSTSYSTVTLVNGGGRVVIVGMKDDWWKVNANGLDGYMAGFLLAVPAKTTANLNIRSGPSTGDEVVGLYPVGSKIELIGIEKGWFETEKGFVSAQYVEINDSPTPGPGPTPEKPVKMVDVSVWDGNIDFEKVKASGITHVMIRSSYGSENPKQVDKKFAQNIDRAIRAGMTIGIYHYGYAKTVPQAEREADFCLKTIRPYRYNIRFPVCYDVEDNAMITSKTNTANMMLAFARKIRSEGYIPWLYCNLRWTQEFIDMNIVDADGIDLWIAQYSSSCSYKGKKAAWQFSDHERVPGIPVTDVDMSYLYKEY